MERTVSRVSQEQSDRIHSHDGRSHFMVALGSWHDIILLRGAVLIMMAICSLEDGRGS
jgi:uncharacterized membrane protein YeiB